MAVMFTNGHVPNQVKEFAVDTFSQLSSIDISQILPPSRVFVMQDEMHGGNSQWYMLNSLFQWIPVDWGGGSGGGGSGSVIYDGGNLDASESTTIYDGGNMEDTSNTSNTNYDGGQP